MKKWIIIGALVLLVVAGGIVGILLGRGGQNGNGNNNSGLIGTIKLPEGSTMKVFFVGPPELEDAWTKIGMADAYQIQLIGTLTNKAGQDVTFDQVVFLLDGKQAAFIPSRELALGGILAPGETVQVARGFGYLDPPKVLEVKVVGFRKVGTPTTTPTTTPTATPTQTPKVFTSAPANPRTPEEVVAAFIFLCEGKNYSAAEKLTTQNFRNLYGSIQKIWEDYFSGRGLFVEKIEIKYLYYQGEEIIVSFVCYFKNGGDSGPVDFTLIKENGQWRLNK